MTFSTNPRILKLVVVSFIVDALEFYVGFLIEKKHV